MSKRKIRADFRKNRNVRQRDSDLTRTYDPATSGDSDAPREERVSGKGELSRRRTVGGTQSDEDSSSFGVVPDVDAATTRSGRVLAVHGLLSIVQADDGTYFRCATRRLLKTLSTDQRHVVAARDRVVFRDV